MLGLLLTPALLLAGPIRIARRSWAASQATTVVLAGGVLLLLLFTAAKGPKIAFAGNFVLADGVLGDGVIGGNRPDILPTGVWPLLIAIGTVAAIVLVLAIIPAAVGLVQRYQSRAALLRDPVTALLGLVIFGYVVAYSLAVITGLPVADRYVIPLIPLVGVLLLRPPVPVLEDPVAETPAGDTRLRSGVAVGALVALGLVGLLYTVDSASFDGTRWKVATAATRAGWGARADPRRVRVDQLPRPRGQARPEARLRDGAGEPPRGTARPARRRRPLLPRRRSAIRYRWWRSGRSRPASRTVRRPQVRSPDPARCAAVKPLHSVRNKDETLSG